MLDICSSTSGCLWQKSHNSQWGEQTGKHQKPDVAYFYGCKHCSKDKQNSPPSQVEHEKKRQSLCLYNV